MVHDRGHDVVTGLAQPRQRNIDRVGGVGAENRAVGVVGGVGEKNVELGAHAIDELAEFQAQIVARTAGTDGATGEQVADRSGDCRRLGEGGGSIVEVNQVRLDAHFGCPA